MSAIHLKQEFKYCEGISWDDVVDKIDNEYKEGTLSFFSFHQLHKGPTQEGDDIYGFMDGYLPDNKKVSPPTFGLHNEYHPNKIVYLKQKLVNQFHLIKILFLKYFWIAS